MPLYGVEFGDQLLGDRGRFLMFTLVEPAKRGPNLHCFIGLRWTDSNDRACQRLEASVAACGGMYWDCLRGDSPAL